VYLFNVVAPSQGKETVSLFFLLQIHKNTAIFYQ